MATLAEIQEAACTSEIGKVIDPIKLLQIMAQTSADYAAEAVPGLDISVGAILSRACTSEIGKVTDEIELLQIIAQLLNDAQ